MARSDRILVGPGRPYDIILVCAVVAVAALLPVYMPSSPLAWFFGFAAVFFCPGYAIVSALLPGRVEVLARTFVQHQERTQAITMLERSAIAIGLSATTVALASTIMTRGLVELNALSVSLTLIGITFAASAVAVRRRSKLPPGDQFIIAYRPPERRPFARKEAAVAALIIVAVMGLGVVASTGLMSDPSGLPYSEFEVAGADGRLDHLPSTLSAGQVATVQITAVNHLGRAADYTLIISLSDSMSATPFDPSAPVSLSPGAGRSTTFTLDDEGSVQRDLSFSISSPGQWTVFLRLVDAGGSEVMTLWMPITVT